MFRYGNKFYPHVNNSAITTVINLYVIDINAMASKIKPSKLDFIRRATGLFTGSKKEIV